MCALKLANYYFFHIGLRNYYATGGIAAIMLYLRHTPAVFVILFSNMQRHYKRIFLGRKFTTGEHR